MSSVPLPRLHRREEGRVVAGVCSGIAAELGVDPTVVRLAFALLALASGSGVAAYLGAWALLPSPEAREAPDRLRFGAGVLLLILACFLALRGLGLADSLIWPAGMIAIGVALVWRVPGGRRFARPFALQAVAGFVLIALGVVSFASTGSPFAGGAPVAPSALAVALVLLVGPWVWRLAREQYTERLARIRAPA